MCNNPQPRAGSRRSTADLDGSDNDELVVVVAVSWDSIIITNLIFKFKDWYSSKVDYKHELCPKNFFNPHLVMEVPYFQAGSGSTFPARVDLPLPQELNECVKYHNTWF